MPEKQPSTEPDTAASSRMLQLFRCCLPERVKLGEIVRNLENADEADCLTVASAEAMIADQLHRRAGKWQNLVTDVNAVEAVQNFMGRPVKTLKGRKFPFKDKSFDVVVVLDALERTQDEEEFIVECHRVLRPAGRIILCVPHAKSWSVVGAFQSLFGQTFERRGQLRPGYVEPHLFHVLKNGFDVHQVHSYLRFFTETVRVITRAVYDPDATTAEPVDERHLRAYRFLYPLYWVAYQLDFLLFFTRGHHLVAMGKRRAWLPRKTPVLTDGRTITEAVLSRIRD